MATSVRLFREMGMKVISSLTYVHYDGAEARMRRTPRHCHAKQWHDSPLQIHEWCQYIGEVILVQLEGNRQTLHERRSNLWHPTFFLLEQAMHAHDVLRRHFLTIATSPRHVFAYACGPRSDVGWPWPAEQPRSFVQRWRPGAAQTSRCHRNSVLCIQMYAWDPWTRLNRPESLFSKKK